MTSSLIRHIVSHELGKPRQFQYSIDGDDLVVHMHGTARGEFDLLCTFNVATAEVKYLAKHLVDDESLSALNNVQHALSTFNENSNMTTITTFLKQRPEFISEALFAIDETPINKAAFINEALQSTELQSLFKTGDEWTKQTLIGHATWDAQQGADLNRITDNVLTTMHKYQLGQGIQKFVGQLKLDAYHRLQAKEEIAKQRGLKKGDRFWPKDDHMRRKCEVLICFKGQIIVKMGYNNRNWWVIASRIDIPVDGDFINITKPLLQKYGAGGYTLIGYYADELPKRLAIQNRRRGVVKKLSLI